MKKVLFGFLIVFIFIFSGCADEFDAKTQFSYPLRIKTRLQGSDSYFTADFSKNGCDITFEDEHPLNGTILCLREDKNTASIGEFFNREVKKGCFPAQEALYKAVKYLNSTDIVAIPNENGLKYTIDEMTIMVYYNKDTESIIGLETEEGGRRFSFSFASFEHYETQSNGASQP